MSIWRKLVNFVTGSEDVQVRNRNKKGQYVADDKSTPNVNEAYVDGKTPKRKPRKKPAAKKAPAKKRGRPRKTAAKK